MSHQLLSALSPPVRLALAYAPAAQRPAATALFALDQRLERQVRQTSESILGQIRLAWWRERLAELPLVPAGEPLLAAIAAAGLQGLHIEAMLDHWERVLLAEDETARFAAWVDARAALFTGFAQAAALDGWAARAAMAGRRWALAELAQPASGHEAERWARTALAAESSQRERLPRALRTLAMLDGWAMSLPRHGNKPLRSGLREMSVMLRIGLFG